MQFSDLTSLIEQFTASHPETLNAAVASGTGVILFFLFWVALKGARGTARFTGRRVWGVWNWATTSKPTPPEAPVSTLCQYILTALHDPRTDRIGDLGIRAPSLILKSFVSLDTKSCPTVPENLDSVKSGEDEVKNLLTSREKILVLIGCWEAWKTSRERAESIISGKVVGNLQKAGVNVFLDPTSQNIQDYILDATQVSLEVPPGTLISPKKGWTKQREMSHHPVINPRTS